MSLLQLGESVRSVCQLNNHWQHETSSTGAPLKPTAKAFASLDAGCDCCDQHHFGSFFINFFAILVNGMNSFI